jgi:hypothetical protein
VFTALRARLLRRVNSFFLLLAKPALCHRGACS